jgi:hypothetical protein
MELCLGKTSQDLVGVCLPWMSLNQVLVGPCLSMLLFISDGCGALVPLGLYRTTTRLSSTTNFA